jgi:hypothetical protein
MAKPGELTPQQEKFAQGVASGLSQAESYRKAYPAALKWKDDSVHNKASTLARHALVRARVAALAKKVEEAFAVDTAKLLREASRLAHSDISNIMHPDGKVKLPHELDPETRAAVASFKIDEYGRIEYKFWDKNSAQERLFKHKGLFEQDNKQKADPFTKLLQSLNPATVGVMPGANRGALDDDHSDD